MGPHATAFAGLWITFKIKKPRREAKWRHNMLGNKQDPKGIPMQVVVNISISQVDCEIQNAVYYVITRL
jgi:hypothetical protein